MNLENVESEDLLKQIDEVLVKSRMRKFIREKLKENEIFRQSDSYYWGFKEAMEKVWNYINEDLKV